MMNLPSHLQRSLLLLFALIVTSIPVCYGQDPFAAPPAGGADPFGAIGAGQGQSAAEQAAAAAQAELEKEALDPVVAAILDAEPTTPVELIRSARDLIDFGAIEEGKAMLAKLMEANIEDEAWAAAHEEFGSGLFIRWLRDQRIHPEGLTVAQAALEAAKRVAADRARLEGFVDRLADPTVAQRNVAANKLRQAGPAAVAPLVSALKDDDKAAAHPLATEVLVSLGPSAVEPLIALFEAPDTHDGLKAHAARILGGLKARRAIPYLAYEHVRPGSSERLKAAAGAALKHILGATPTPPEAAVYLHRRAAEHFAGRRPVSSNALGMADLWHWDDEQGTVVSRQHRIEDAASVVASQFAWMAYRLNPDAPHYRRLYLQTAFSVHKILGGLDQPLDVSPGSPLAAAMALPTAALEDAMLDAMEQDQMPAAIGLAEALGEVGGAMSLELPGHFPPLVRAMEHGNRRLRFAAAQSIAKIDRKEQFTGAGHLIDALGHMARSSGSHRIAVAHPIPARGQTIVGLFTTFLFSGDSATTGKAFFKKATAHPDIDFLLISEAIDHPPADELVQWLRREPATRNLPIGIVARRGQEQRAERIASLVPMAVAVPTPVDRDSALFVLDRMTDLAGREQLTPEEKTRHAETAVRWLSHYAKRWPDYRFYDLTKVQTDMESAFYNPELSAMAAKYFGQLATPRAQTTLIDLASQNTLPLAHRQAAAQAFAEAVARQNVQLTRDQVLLQYDRYNQSATLDRQTQKLLGSILDVIENPGRKLD